MSTLKKELPLHEVNSGLERDEMIRGPEEKQGLLCLEGLPCVWLSWILGVGDVRSDWRAERG